MPNPSSHAPLAKGEIFDRPPFEDVINWLFMEYETTKLAFDDAFKDASRHDQVQLFDSMVARASDFRKLGTNLLSTEDHGEIQKIAAEIIAMKVNEGTMLTREERISDMVDYMVGELHRAGYVIAKRRPVVVPSDYAQ